MTIRANSVQARDITHVLHPYTNLKVHERIGPTVISSGQGIYVRDDEGRDYIEAVAGLWSASLGFGGEDSMVEAIAAHFAPPPFARPQRCSRRRRMSLVTSPATSAVADDVRRLHMPSPFARLRRRTEDAK